MARRSKPKQPIQPLRDNRHLEVRGLILMGCGLFMAVILILGLFNENNGGALGVFLRNLMYGCFGAASWVTFVVLLIVGFNLMRYGNKGGWKPAPRTVTFWSLLLIFLIVAYQVSFSSLSNRIILNDNSYGAALGECWRASKESPMVACGVLGGLITWPLVKLVGHIGTWIIATIGILSSSVFLFNFSLGKAARGAEKAARATGRTVKKSVTTSVQRLKADPTRDTHNRQASQVDALLGAPFADSEAPPEPEPDPTPEPDPIFAPAETPVEPPMRSILEPAEWEAMVRGETGAADGASMAPPAPTATPPIAPIPSASVPTSEPGDAAPEPSRPETSSPIIRTGNINYHFPPLELLSADKPTVGDSQSEIRERGKVIEDVLESFGVKATVVSVSIGPVITRYEVQPAPGVRISRIAGLANDISLRLAASGVRIEAPVPNRDVVGIEVPNQHKALVTLRSVLQSQAFAQSKRLAVGVGKDVAGQAIVSDVVAMNHLLVAGATGGGKSVCVNSLLVSLLYRHSPADLKMILIDPKKVEFNVYEGIPHLITPVVTNAKKAFGALAWAVDEMERRYLVLSQAKARNLQDYNDASKTGGYEKMPYLVIVVDEVADLMSVAAKEVETCICRLAQKGRAAGVHLILATQRPSHTVITGDIKANIPSSIAFAVRSAIDSRIILDQMGAEKLLKDGDMLFFPVGSRSPMRVQGCFVDTREVNAVVTFIRNQGFEPEYDEAVMESMNASDQEAGAGNDSAPEGSDPLLGDAVLMVAERGEASVSHFQRRLGVGHARAGRLIDIMERMGFVSEQIGPKPRKVLISREEAAEFAANYEPGKSSNQD